jgi:hypothetical protein
MIELMQRQQPLLVFKILLTFARVTSLVKGLRDMLNIMAANIVFYLVSYGA